MLKTLSISALLFVAVSCSKKSDSGAADNKRAEGEPPAKLAYKKLGALGLEAEVPEGANIDDTSKGAGYPSVTIYASPTFFVGGAGEMSDLKPTLEETKAQLVRQEKSLKPVREEKTADGWIIEMAGESMGSPITAVSVRRTVDSKPWDCSSNVSSKDEVARLERMCQSLRAAK
jgi:hypothetical protein